MARYGWSERFCWVGMSSAKSRVYDNLAREQEMTVFGMVWERKTPGYVKQELERLKKQNGRKRKNLS